MKRKIKITRANCNNLTVGKIYEEHPKDDGKGTNILIIDDFGKPVIVPPDLYECANCPLEVEDNTPDF